MGTTDVSTAPEHRHAGLSDVEAQRRLTHYGANELPGAGRRNLYLIAFDVIREPMFLLLVAGGIIYFALGDVREALILLVSVFVVMGITFYQEHKTERTLEALRDLSSPRALVIRDSVPRRISGRDVVPGDLVILGEGDRVAADGVLLECNRFTTDESLLTGESLPAAKQFVSGDIADMDEPGSENSPFIYSGTLVVQGQGIARILATGTRTQIGKIGKALQRLDIERTPLQQQTARAIRVFAVLGATLCVLVVFLYAAYRGGWLDGFLAGITLAMAVLPEEFPVVLTVFLALGAWRISQKRVLTRRMPAVETLGSATVLCVDKTGTLTENRMAVAEIVGDNAIDGADDSVSVSVLRIAALACERDPSDPMERAILRHAHESAPDIETARNQWKLVREYDLTPELLAVAHCWQKSDSDELVVAIKGAPETVANLCRLNASTRDRILAETAELAARGRRVLAVAEGTFRGTDFPADASGFAVSYRGLIALADPVRNAVPEALRICRDAGVRVVMITGDYPGTADAIARQIGLASPGGILTGKQISVMNDTELRECAKNVNVFARVVPEQKLRLVHALKSNGEIVAMTGDGVNDAPALKAAHIGIAMGTRGTDVAREASALVLLDDDFTSIVDTIALGRRIFDNIRHAMSYLLAVHVPTAGIALVPLIAGWPLVFFPVHIVFMEFVIDPACSIAFEAEPGHPNIMKRPPRRPHEPLFGTSLLWSALVQGLIALLVTTLLYGLALEFGVPEARARALAFATLVMSNIVMILSNRSQTRSVFTVLAVPNRALWFVTGGALAGLLLALYLPPLRDVFRFDVLGWQELLMAAVGASISIIWSELFKLLQRRRTPSPA